MPKKPSGIVIHYTAAGSGKGSANYFAGKAAGVSAHFVIDRDGTVYQCVSLKDKAWHAGVSQWPTGTKQKNCNDFTIGIELANWGWLTKDSTGKVTTYTKAVFNGPTVEIAGKIWEAYPEAMIESLQELLAVLSQKLGIQINPVNVVGHEHIAPKRKIDPGPAFPWSTVLQTH